MSKDYRGLERCPFCGSDASEEEEGGKWVIRCTNVFCQAQIVVPADTSYCARQVARESWNRRTK